jgi:hypothetical protein
LQAGYGNPITLDLERKKATGPVLGDPKGRLPTRSNVAIKPHKREVRTRGCVCAEKLYGHKLCRKCFAAAPATRAHHFTATGGRFACKEAMPTGTHEIAWLESPLHIVLE